MTGTSPIGSLAATVRPCRRSRCSPRNCSQPGERRLAPGVGAPNPVTGKTSLGLGYAPSTVAHSETVLCRFYGLHRDARSGPLINPFPLDLACRSGRMHSHEEYRLLNATILADPWPAALDSCHCPDSTERAAAVGVQRSGRGAQCLVSVLAKSSAHSPAKEQS